MSVYIKGMEMPKGCVKCEWRDAEAGGDCELMICNPFETYTEQYKHCPFQVISKRHSLVPVPEHGRWRLYSPLTDTYECDKCGYQVIDESFRTNYCPNCGAKMDGEA
jgi:hypothetical protein